MGRSCARARQQTKDIAGRHARLSRQVPQMKQSGKQRAGRAKNLPGRTFSGWTDPPESVIFLAFLTDTKTAPGSITDVDP